MSNIKSLPIIKAGILYFFAMGHSQLVDENLEGPVAQV